MGITPSDIRQFLVHLQTEVCVGDNNPRIPKTSRPLSPRTVHGYARTLRAFFYWLESEEYLEKSPMRKVKMPKVPTVVIKTFSEEQLNRLLSVIDRKTAIGYRDYCIVLTLLDTGIRLSELTGLTLPNLSMERGEFKVMGKGAKERWVPFGATLQRVLWKYIHKWRPDPAHPDIQNVFLTVNGTALSGGSVTKLLAVYGRKAGLRGVRCSPHTFRHTFAKTYLMNGGDLFSLQKILGHTSLEMVRIYVNLVDEDVKNQHRKYSPLDRLGLVHRK
jgi:integrase/recombinase XerD